MQDSIISVLIPSYNHSKYIIECIDSIINQTYKNIELIIIDDGSQDDTDEKITKITNLCNDRFVKFLYIRHEKNRGIIQTEKELLAASNGEFIFHTASDDVLKDKDAIKKLYKFLSDNDDCGLVFGDNNFIDSDSKECYMDNNWNIFDKKNDQNYDSFVELLLSNRKDLMIESEYYGSYHSFLKSNYVTNGFLVKKEIYDYIENYNTDAPLEDWFLMLQVSKFCKIKLIKDKILSYRIHQNNQSKDRDQMERITYKTLDYEKKLLEFPKYKKYKEIAQRFIVGKRINIPFIFEYCKKKNLYKKVTTISVMNISIYKKTTLVRYL